MHWNMERRCPSTSYTVLYSDARGVSRVSLMSLTYSRWRMWHDHLSFSQRFEAVLSDDSSRMAGHWEKALKGGGWEDDFNVEYARL
jgi:hypothetical protein